MSQPRSNRWVVWDLDGVVIPGRGTTWLAESSEEDPTKFIERFISEAESGKAPFDVVEPSELKEGFKEWETNYNNGRPIETIGQLASCLTDLRHELEVFPSSDQTKYTKNAILEGMTVDKIQQVAKNLEFNPNAKETINRFNEDENIKQALYSTSNGIFVDAVADLVGIDYSKGTPPKVKTKQGTEFYYPEILDEGKASLTGKIDTYYNKKQEIMDYIEQNGIDSEKTFAIDDTSTDMLLQLREKGVNVVGYYNPDDPKANSNYKEAMEGEGIKVVEKDLGDFADYVLSS